MYSSCNCNCSECSTSSQSFSEIDSDFNQCCCCQYKCKNKPFTRGKFGLAYIVETPQRAITRPLGWQVEFEDTPSGVIHNCNHMEEWVNCPPIKCHTHFTEYPPVCGKILNHHRRTTRRQPECDKCRINAPIMYPGHNSHTSNFPDFCKNSGHTPKDYQGHYWYTDQSGQHCWSTSETIGLDSTCKCHTQKDTSTNSKPDEALDYIPIREDLDKNKMGKIVKVKDCYTQHIEEISGSHEIISTSRRQESAVIIKFENKQVDTKSMDDFDKQNKNNFATYTETEVGENVNSSENCQKSSVENIHNDVTVIEKSDEITSKDNKHSISESSLKEIEKTRNSNETKEEDKIDVDNSFEFSSAKEIIQDLALQYVEKNHLLENDKGQNPAVENINTLKKENQITKKKSFTDEISTGSILQPDLAPEQAPESQNSDLKNNNENYITDLNEKKTGVQKLKLAIKNRKRLSV